MIRSFVILLASCGLIALSACSREQEPDAKSETAPEAVAGDELATTAVPEPAEPLSEPDGGAGIPVALQGRWGLVPDDCTSDRGDAKGLLRITRDKLEFYESVARLGEVQERAPDRIRAVFGFSGEGQQWTLEIALAARDGGETLVRRDFGPDAVQGPLRYTRCG